MLPTLGSGHKTGNWLSHQEAKQCIALLWRAEKIRECGERQTSVTTKKAERLAVMDEDNYALNSTEIIKLDNSSQEMHWCIWNEENTTIRCTYSQRRNGTLHCTASSNYFKLKISVDISCCLRKLDKVKYRYTIYMIINTHFFTPFDTSIFAC